MKILALRFVLLIGVMLIPKGAGEHVSKGYRDFAMAFSLLTEVLSIRLRKRQKPVTLHGGTQRFVKPS